LFSRLKGARPSPALVVSLIALFVSLGGVGYAAATIGSSQIKNNSVQSKDVKNSSLTGKDIKNSSLGGADVKNESLKGSDVNESTFGQVPSAANADKASSADNATNAGTAANSKQLGGLDAAKFLHEFHQVSATSVSDSNDKGVSATCNVGEVAMGGSGVIGGAPVTPANVIVSGSNVFQQFTIFSLTLPAGFTANGTETDPDAGNWTVTATVVCAKAG
jgi:hypothetical protein